MVVTALGLHRIDGTARRHLLHRQHAAGNEAAATGRHEDHVGHQAHRRGFLGHFQPAGALAGNDARIVIGRDQRSASALGFRACQSLAVIGHAIEGDDGRAPSLGGPGLDGRGIGRHEDGGRQAASRRRIGRRLGVVAGGEGDDRRTGRGRRGCPETLAW